MSSPGFCADGGSFPAACTCIPGLARGVERAQRTDLEVKNLTNDGISSHFRLAAVVQSPARSPRHPQTRGPLTFRLERAFHTCLCRFPIKNSAASAAPPSRTTNHEPRTTNHEISILTIPGHAVMRLTHEYRICLKPIYLTKDTNNYFFTGREGFLVSAIHFVKSSGETPSTLSAQGFHFSDFFLSLTMSSIFFPVCSSRSQERRIQ